MKRILALVIFSILFLQGISSINPPIIDTSIIISKVKKLASDPTILRLDEEFFRNLLIVNDSLCYLNPQGTLHLFEIKITDSTKVTKISTSKYHGFNFGRNLFYHDSSLYSAGGSGLFNSFSGIIKFDFETREWFKKPVVSNILNLESIVTSWIIDGELHIIYHLTSENNKEYCYGYINLSDFQFHELNRFSSYFDNSTKIMQFGGTIIASSNIYDLHKLEEAPNNCVYRIYDKRKGIMLRSTFLNHTPCIDGNSFVYLKDNVVFKRNNFGEVDSIIITESTIFKSTDVMKNYRKSESVYSQLEFYLFIGGFMLLLVIIGFVVKSIRKKAIHENDIVDIIQDQLKGLKGNYISRKELDEILKISHLSSDSSKVLRSKRIKSVNDREGPNISRVRNPEDKRQYIYKVS